MTSLRDFAHELMDELRDSAERPWVASAIAFVAALLLAAACATPFLIYPGAP